MSLAHQDLAWSDMFQTDVGSELHLFGLRTQKDKADRRPIQSSVRAMHARVGEFSPMGMSLASLFLLARAFLQRSSPMPSHAAQQAERGQFAPLTPDLTKTP